MRSARTWPSSGSSLHKATTASRRCWRPLPIAKICGCPRTARQPIHACCADRLMPGGDRGDREAASWAASQKRRQQTARERDCCLVLLRHTYALFRDDRDSVQHGHRLSAAARRAAISRRRVAIESGTWRSVRIGSAPRPVVVGKGRFFEEPGERRF